MSTSVYLAGRDLPRAGESSICLRSPELLSISLHQSARLFVSNAVE